MYYLSRMEICQYARRSAVALQRRSIIHGAVENAFETKKSRKLWRLDQLGNSLYLLIVSEGKPDLTSAYQQFGKPGTDPVWETRNYSDFLEKIQTGNVWRFRLVANPTKSEHGSIRSVPESELKDWLIARSTSNGFLVDKDKLVILSRQWIDFQKRASSPERVKFLSVTYEGILTVTDHEAFVKALVAGIGREKVYGQGMITLAAV